MVKLNQFQQPIHSSTRGVTYLKLEFLIESLSSDVSNWPSVGFCSVYKINLVLMTLLGNGNTLNGR